MVPQPMAVDHRGLVDRGVLAEAADQTVLAVAGHPDQVGEEGERQRLQEVVGIQAGSALLRQVVLRTERRTAGPGAEG